MLIKDLYKGYHRYLNNKEKLEKIANKKLELMNQPIFIRDLVVRTKAPHCFGEATDHTNAYPYLKETDRIVDQVELLFNLANLEHLAKNFEKNEGGGSRLKAGKENHITRLSTHEFFFYTEEDPLPQAKFSKMVAKIEKMAEKLEANTLVLLGSFAVVNAEDQIMNISLLVEGGKPARIHSLAKNTAYKGDIDYKAQKELFSQQGVSTWPNHHVEFVATEDDPAIINNGSLIEITAVGGAHFTQAIDICLDHHQGHSRALSARKIGADGSPDEFIPEQIEQCVISNTVRLVDEATFSDEVLHVDPRVSMIDDYDGKADTSLVKQASLDELKDSNYAKYEELSLEKRENRYLILNPPFGSDCTVEIIAERPAGTFKPEWAKAVEASNQRAISRYAKRMVNVDQEKMDKIAQNSTLFFKFFAQLNAGLLAKCEPTVLENLFKPEEYYNKLEAQRIINNAFKEVRTMIEFNEPDNIFRVNTWSKRLAFQLHNLDSMNPKDSFANSLVAVIDEATTKLGETFDLEFEKNDFSSPQGS